ncbi:uncharacterized protein N7511_008360 [Penicillium nucicola]|uniref:uncharacterized protein n=1 Tax=Penicillium nucicola TaxID=1850975 RepID=UPI0025457627|nr:uncharacterized protein N7511_008360 [Penicillium nucicola]KAJ5751395.1 hypothetical protein N7511_008360 [Penicillium nucicola]
MGKLPILLDEKEVSDAFSISQLQMEEMIIWDPEQRKTTKDRQSLVTQRETYAILEDIFGLQILKPPSTGTNRIAYFEEISESSTVVLKLGGEVILLQTLEEHLPGLVENVSKMDCSSSLPKAYSIYGESKQ